MMSSRNGGAVPRIAFPFNVAGILLALRLNCIAFLLLLVKHFMQLSFFERSVLGVQRIDKNLLDGGTEQSPNRRAATDGDAS